MYSRDDFKEELQRLKTLERLRRLEPRKAEGVYLIEKNGNRLCNFGSNDYLGFAVRTPAVSRQGAGASALVSGWTDQHQDLADQLAIFESTEAACLFPTGYAACSGVVSTLAGENDIIFSDALNHASLIDGCRLSKAKCLVYPHRDMATLRQILHENRSQYRNAWIVTDGVFSMDGHLAPLEQICDLRDEFDLGVIVDEAHATGVLGKQGKGVAELLGVKQRVDVVIGTLSKGIGSHGGFVASNSETIDYLINHCRTLIYSTALPPNSVAAASESLRRVQSNTIERERVTSFAQFIRQELGITVGSHETGIPIIPLIVGEDHKAVSVSNSLHESGFYVPAIRPPTVPSGTARLRISVTPLHSQEMVEQLLSHLRHLL